MKKIGLLLIMLTMYVSTANATGLQLAGLAFSVQGRYVIDDNPQRLSTNSAKTPDTFNNVHPQVQLNLSNRLLGLIANYEGDYKKYDTRTELNGSSHVVGGKMRLGSDDVQIIGSAEYEEIHNSLGTPENGLFNVPISGKKYDVTVSPKFKAISASAGESRIYDLNITSESLLQRKASIDYGISISGKTKIQYNAGYLQYYKISQGSKSAASFIDVGAGLVWASSAKTESHFKLSYRSPYDSKNNILDTSDHFLMDTEISWQRKSYSKFKLSAVRAVIMNPNAVVLSKIENSVTLNGEHWLRNWVAITSSIKVEVDELGRNSLGENVPLVFYQRYQGGLRFKLTRIFHLEGSVVHESERSNVAQVKNFRANQYSVSVGMTL